MTIRRYLFLLISGLLLTVAVAQVVALLFFKNNLEEEVDRRGRAFADRVITFALDNYEKEINSDVPGKTYGHQNKQVSSQTPVIQLEVNKTFNIEISTRKGDKVERFEFSQSILQAPDKFKTSLTHFPSSLVEQTYLLAKNLINSDANFIKTKTRDYTIKLSTNTPPSRQKLKEHFKKQIAKFKKNETGPETQIEFTSIVTDNVERRGLPPILHRPIKQKSLIDKMVNIMTFIILLTTIFGLFLVFWLSNKFSSPLQQLIDGFKKLEKGEFGVQVPPTGVEEVKQTIVRFNSMSDQLVQLAKAEQKLQQQTHLTEISDVSKGIAHALRNPMHTIGLAIEQLQNIDDNPKLANKLFDRIKNKINQLDKNIKALLTITTGEINREETVNLVTTINDVILELKQTYNDTNKALNLTTNLNQPVTVIGSEQEIRSVIHTLLFNAYEAHQQLNEDTISINIKLLKENGHAVIYINDHGSGLDKQIEANIFQPHNSNKAEGAGMGLYISKRIVELYYDGTLEIENRIENDTISGVTVTCKMGSVVEVKPK